MTKKGFSLIELVCVLAVVSVLLAAVLYVHGGRGRSYRTHTAISNQLMADIRYARRRAIMEGIHVGVDFDIARNRYMVVEPNSIPRVIIRTVYLPDYVRIVEPRPGNLIAFLPRGTPTSGFSVRLETEYHITAVYVVGSGARVRAETTRR